MSYGLYFVARIFTKDCSVIWTPLIRAGCSILKGEALTGTYSAAIAPVGGTVVHKQ